MCIRDSVGSEMCIRDREELSFSLKLKEDSKLLWKIAIQIRPDVDTLIHLTVS
jgi:hypothetical protein